MKSLNTPLFLLSLLSLCACSPSAPSSSESFSSFEESFSTESISSEGALSSSEAPSKVKMEDLNPRFYGPIAHRGYHDETNPKNSLNAFRAACEKGFGIETDVHITSDDKLIISHDSMLTGYGNIETNEFEDIRNNVLLEDGEMLPSLEETYECVKESSTPLLVELKTFGLDDENPTKLGNAVLAETRRLGVDPKNVIFCSFSWEAILPILDSEYAAGLFISNGTNKELIDPVLGEKDGLQNPPDFVAAGYDVLTNPKCVSYRSHGHKVFSWTLTSQSMYDQVKDSSDGYIFENFLPA